MLQPLAVAPHHKIKLTGESGWAAAYKLRLFDGKPQATTYTPPGYSAHPVLKPDHIVEIGDHVRGVCFFRRLGTQYIAVTRCAYQKNFPCAVEFHFLPAKSTVSSSGAGSFAESYTLDGGIPPAGPAAKPKVCVGMATQFVWNRSSLCFLSQGQRGGSGRRTRQPKPGSDQTPGKDPVSKEVEARGSVALKMRVPMGAGPLKYYSDAKNSFFLVTFSSGAVGVQVSMLCGFMHVASLPDAEVP